MNGYGMPLVRRDGGRSWIQTKDAWWTLECMSQENKCEVCSRASGVDAAPRTLPLYDMACKIGVDVHLVCEPAIFLLPSKDPSVLRQDCTLQVQ